MLIAFNVGQLSCSPKQILVQTVGDMLRAASPASKVIALSAKDRVRQFGQARLPLLVRHPCACWPGFTYFSALKRCFEPFLGTLGSSTKSAAVQ